MRGFRKAYGRGAYNGTIVSKCYITVLIKIPFEFTRSSKFQIVVHIRGELLLLGACKWGGLLSLGAFNRMYIFCRSQVNGPITGGKGGGVGGGAYKWARLLSLGTFNRMYIFCCLQVDGPITG